MKERNGQLRYLSIVIGAFLSVGVIVGLTNNLYSLYVIPITTGLGISRGLYSMGITVRYIASAFCNLFMGRLYQRFGYRRPTVLLVLLVAASYVGYGTARNAVPLFLGALIYGVGEYFISTAALSRMLGNWFQSHLGVVTGIVMAASGVGGSALSLVLSGIMESAGWRTSLLFAAGLLAAVAVMIFFVMKDRPEELGLQPYHDPERRGAAHTAHHPPAGNPGDEGRGGEEPTGDHVGEAPQEGGVGEQRPDVFQARSPGFGVIDGADGMLHERVRRDDEEAGDVHRDRDQPDAGEVQEFRQPGPAEDPQSEEGGFEEERDQPLERQGRAEDVPDEPGVLAPVHAELEFLYEAGGHADREVDEEQFAEEPGQLQPVFLPGRHPHRLHDRHQWREAEGERNEDEVVNGGDPELPSGQIKSFHDSPVQ